MTEKTVEMEIFPFIVHIILPEQKIAQQIKDLQNTVQDNQHN